MMKRFKVAGGVVMAGVLGGCATSGGPELVECLQPDRRVVVEINGTRVKPPPKPKPGQKPVPAKPGRVAVALRTMAPGNSAWDPGKAVLKDGGKEELSKFLKSQVSGKLPTTVSAIIITGHSDRLEGSSTDLSEARAKAVREYLVSQGMDQKLMFWEGRGSKQPVPVTKFCSS